MSAGTAAKARAITSPVSDPTCVSMTTRIGPQRAAHTAKRTRNGVADPRRRDVVTASVALAHADAERGHTNAEVAARYALEPRTVSDWRRTGPPEARAFAGFLFESSDPWRWIASMKALARQRVFRDWTDDELIQHFHALRAKEKELESLDTVQDLRPGVSWLDRAAAKERDAGVDEKLSGLMREFAARGISEARVFGRGW